MEFLSFLTKQCHLSGLRGTAASQAHTWKTYFLWGWQELVIIVISEKICSTCNTQIKQLELDIDKSVWSNFRILLNTRKFGVYKSFLLKFPSQLFMRRNIESVQSCHEDEEMHSFPGESLHVTSRLSQNFRMCGRMSFAAVSLLNTQSNITYSKWI